MAEKICLDTDVCIDIINGESRAEKLRSLIIDKVANFLTNASLISFDGNFNKKHFSKVKGLKLLDF